MSPLQQSAGFKNRLDWKLYTALAFPWTAFLLLRIPMMFPSIFCGHYLSGWVFHAVAGECYWYTSPSAPTRYGLGIAVHLGAVVPSGLLAVLQFTPAIRQRYRRLHRLAGYASTAGVLVGNAGAIAVADRAFGGDMATRVAVAVLASTTTYSVLRAVAEARAKHIAAHRAWMLRAWAHLGAILTMRPFIAVLAQAVSLPFAPGPGLLLVVPCREIMFRLAEVEMDGAQVLPAWPVCDPASKLYDLDGSAVVRADIHGNVIEEMAAIRAAFGPALWIALVLHIIAVEWYLQLSNEARAGKAGDGKPVVGVGKDEKKSSIEAK